MASEDAPDSGKQPAGGPSPPPAISVREPLVGPSGNEKEAEIHDSTAPGSVEDLMIRGGLGKKRIKPGDGGEGDGFTHCRCKKSRCLKLYCVCFAGGSYCSDSCACRQCINKPVYGETVVSTRKELCSRNQCAFVPKVVQMPEAGQEARENVNKSPASAQLKRGCNCKKSSCLKKYCDCYQGGGGCSIFCRCEDCQNPFGRKTGSMRNLPSIEQNDGDFGPSEEEEEEDAAAIRSPLHRSPISRESSFQQDCPGDAGALVADKQLYPQPLSQRQPQPWYPKRNNDDRISEVMVGYLDYKPRIAKILPCQDKYSISKCIDVMNGMEELSPHEKSLAPDVFLEPSNREIFLSLNADIRTMWLRRKVQHLT